MNNTADGSIGRSQYRFVRRIATGGMAELYLGEARGVGGVTKRVALKRMLPSHAQDHEFLTMFLEEARLASTLQHPNIVQTYDVIQSGEEYLIVMEFLEGADLHRFRRRMRTQHETLTLEHTLFVIRAVLQGLHHAHDAVLPNGRTQGIVHRDVSPQNIYLTFGGGVKLLDFGIAKSDSNLNHTESGILKGKVLYMSPEQCGSGRVDRRSDLYSVGVVLYQLLTETVPHRGRDAYDTMRSIIETDPPLPSQVNSRIHPNLEQIVQKSMRRRPAERYATAWEMLTDIEAFAKENGLFASTVGFATLVDRVLGPRKPPSETTTLVLGTRDLPPSIAVDATSAGRVTPMFPGGAAAPQAPERVLASSDRYTLRRLHGVQVLALHGVLDEGFDVKALGELLKGEVIVDTGEVSRITSFGIRSLIHLMGSTRGGVTGLYHHRCSVPIINQVTMIRGLLGGGRILSFHAPYVDPVTGTYFTTLLSGDEGQRAVTDHVLPDVRSQTDRSIPAQFDDDVELYLNFAHDFLAEPPPHLSQALQALEDRARHLDVELTLEAEGPVLTIRRAIDGDARWSRVLGGLEGRARLELEKVQRTTPTGAQAFVTALESAANTLRAVELVGAPVPLCEALALSRPLRPIISIRSVQVQAQCTSCGTRRRASVAMDDLRESSTRPHVITSACGRCGSNLDVISALDGLDAFGLSTMAGPIASVPAKAELPTTRSRGCLRSASTAALLVGIVGGASVWAVWLG